MISTRRIEPELLDALPADDPRAVRSRLDLRRVNAWMQQPRIMARLLLAHSVHEPRTILELGGGDGTFMLDVARRIGPRWQGVTLLLLDQQDIVDQKTRKGFRALGWALRPVVADVFDWLASPNTDRIDVVVANLFLHHFPPERLARLVDLAARLAPLFVACEPRRGPAALAASRMLWTLGCNDVSRHDAVASVRAGFSGKELSGHWPQPSGWSLQEQECGPFTHCFAARRHAKGPSPCDTTR